MCGISGICNFERKPSLETVKKMSQNCDIEDLMMRVVSQMIMFV